MSVTSKNAYQHEVVYKANKDVSNITPHRLRSKISDALLPLKRAFGMAAERSSERQNFADYKAVLNDFREIRKSGLDELWLFSSVRGSVVPQDEFRNKFQVNIGLIVLDGTYEVVTDNGGSGEVKAIHTIFLPNQTSERNKQVAKDIVQKIITRMEEKIKLYSK